MIVVHRCVFLHSLPYLVDLWKHGFGNGAFAHTVQSLLSTRLTLLAPMIIPPPQDAFSAELYSTHLYASAALVVPTSSATLPQLSSAASRLGLSYKRWYSCPTSVSSFHRPSMSP